MAKYYEFTEQDVVFTVLTDTAEMYRSRVEELREQYGEYTPQRAAMDYALRIAGQKTDNMLELTTLRKSAFTI